MTPMGVVDNLVSKLLSNRLFEEKGKGFSGMDIAAINIQRGRDHGIPGYNKYRQFCGLQRASSFAEFLPEIPQTHIDKLQLVYSHPDDVDLFPGLLVETKLQGAIVGPTLACLIGHQFRDLRTCDRFWYETGDTSLKFTADQLTEIRGQTLSALLCRNYDEPGKIQ